MAGTIELATVIDHIVGRGGSVRLIGDDQQLAAIGAGGVLRDIAASAGAVTLDTAVRFTPRRGRTTPRPQHRSRCVTAIRPRSPSTPTMTASTSAMPPPRPIRPTRRGPPTARPDWTRCCWPRPAAPSGP